MPTLPENHEYRYDNFLSDIDQWARGGATVRPRGVAGFGADSQAAFDATRQRAGGADYERGFADYLNRSFGQQQYGLDPAAQTAGGLMGGLEAGQSALGQLAGGGANPYLSAMFGQASRGMVDQFQNAVMPGINQVFGGAGRSGSGLQMAAMQGASDTLGQNLGGLAANIYGGAYDADANRRLAAAQALQGGAVQGMGGLGNIYGLVSGDQARAGGLAGTLAGMEWNNINQLGQMGATQDSRQQDWYNAQYEAQLASRDEGYRRRQLQMGALYGYPGVNEDEGPPGWLGPVIGGATMLAGAAAAPFTGGASLAAVPAGAGLATKT